MENAMKMKTWTLDPKLLAEMEKELEVDKNARDPNDESLRLVSRAIDMLLRTGGEAWSVALWLRFLASSVEDGSYEKDNLGYFDSDA
jgi:hypothetical protein